MNSANLRMLVSMALAAPAGVAFAQQSPEGTALPADTSKWECKLCPYPKGGSGDVDVGAVNVDSDSFQFGRYTGLKKGTYPGLDANAHYDEGASYIDLQVSDLGLPYRSLDYEQGLNGQGKLNFRYAELPFLISDSARTPFSGAGSADLRLPPTWVPGTTTQTMPGLNSSLQDVRIESGRKQFNFGLAAFPTREWQVGMNFQHETREGTKRIAGSFFLNATQLVAPVDYTTEQLEAYASYAAPRWQVRFAYQASIFTDGNPALRWDNPFAETLPGATVGQLALPPSNEFHQLSASGGYDISDSTRATAMLAFGRMLQDEPFLPATISPTIAPVALPRNSLNGQVDTTRAELKLVSALSAQWALNVAYSYDDRNNKTPQSTFNWVTTDLQLSATPRTNLPYSFTRNLLKVSGDYRITPRDKATLGIDHDVQDRTFQEVSKTTENTAWAKYALQRSQFDVSLNYAHSRRYGTSYTPVPEIVPPENPLLRKFNMADRDRDLVGARAAATPWENVTIGFDYSQANDDYNNSQVGLTSAREYTVGLVNYAETTEVTSLRLFYSRQRIKSNQAGAQSFSNPPDWTSDNTDTIQTAGIGVKHGLVPDTMDIGADLTSSRSVGDIKVSTALNEPGFPSIKSDLDSFKLWATYKVKADLMIRASLWHERYSSQNWAIDGVGPSTIPNVLTLGETSPQYKVNVASVSLRYRF